MLKQQCSSKCSDCAVAGIVVHGTREGVHTAGGDQSPSHRQTKGQTGHGQWQLRHFPRGLCLSRKRASKQVVRRGSCFSSPHTNKRWAVRIVGTEWRPVFRQLICCLDLCFRHLIDKAREDGEGMLNTTLDHQQALRGPRRMRCSPRASSQKICRAHATTRVCKQGRGRLDTPNSRQCRDLWRRGNWLTTHWPLCKGCQYLGTQRSRPVPTPLGPSSQSVSHRQHRHASRQKYRSSLLRGNVTNRPVQSLGS